MNSVLAFVVLLSVSVRAFAQPSWPERPIRMVVAAAAGGPTDSIVRIIGTELGKRLGQPVVVENRPGASGMVATEAVARAPGDGYTFLAVFGSYAVNRVLHSKRPYSDADLTGVSLIGRYPMLLVAAPGMPNSLRGLIDYARANPGAVTYASGGEGTLAHLAAEVLMQSTGTKLTHVPYKGGNTALPDLFAGRVGIVFDTVSVLAPHVHAKKLQALGLSDVRRSPELPEVPTFAESGLPVMTAYGWTAVIAPSKTPPAIVERMSMELQTLLDRGDIKATLGGGIYGMELVGGTPAQTNRFIDEEEKRWGDVIRKANIRAQ
jgi:tripartite-type tricarboxylate transporter receptor subunit TctC